MRIFLIALPLLAACSNEANHMGNPLMLPVTGVSTAIGNTAYNKRRGEVEVIVKSNFDRIRQDIVAGGGPVLDKAMDAARIPVDERPARIIQLQGDMGIYAGNPGALVTALMVYGQ